VPGIGNTVVTGSDGRYYVYATAVNVNVYQKVNTEGTLGALVCPVTADAPGAAGDRTNVVERNGANYLDDGGGYYYAKGADNKLGTADDKMMYDNAGTLVPAPYIPAGATSFTDRTGVTWRILKDNRVGAPAALDGSTSSGDGTILLVTDRVYSHGDTLNWGGYNTPYHNTNVFVKYDAADGSYKTTLNDWYTNLVSPELKALARIPSLGYEADDIMTTGWSATMDANGAISTPGAAAGTQTDQIAFPLSISEVTRYIGTTNAARGAVDSAGNGENTTNYPYRYWRLRSPGSSATDPTSGVVSDGSVGATGTSWGHALRPGLWINTTPTP
jgi:hypothetical protein